MAHRPLASNLKPSRPTSGWPKSRGWTLQAFGNKCRVQPVQPVQPFSHLRARVMLCGWGSSYFSYTSVLGWTGWTGWTQPIKSTTWRVQPLFRPSAEVGQVGRGHAAGPSRATRPCDENSARHFASRAGSNLTEHPEHVCGQPNTPNRRRRLSMLATLSTRSKTLPHWENPAPNTRRRMGRPGKDPRALVARTSALHRPPLCPVGHPNSRGNHGHRRSS